MLWTWTSATWRTTLEQSREAHPARRRPSGSIQTRNGSSRVSARLSAITPDGTECTRTTPSGRIRRSSSDASAAVDRARAARLSNDRSEPSGPAEQHQCDEHRHGAGRTAAGRRRRRGASRRAAHRARSVESRDAPVWRTMSSTQGPSTTSRHPQPDQPAVGREQAPQLAAAEQPEGQQDVESGECRVHRRRAAPVAAAREQAPRELERTGGLLGPVERIVEPGAGDPPAGERRGHLPVPGGHGDRGDRSQTERRESREAPGPQEQPQRRRRARRRRRSSGCTIRPLRRRSRPLPWQGSRRRVRAGASARPARSRGTTPSSTCDPRWSRTR